MAYTQRQLPTVPPKQQVSLVFGDVKGVDFRSDDTAPTRSPDSVNMYRSRLGLWESHVGFRKIGYVGKNIPVWDIHRYTYRDPYGEQKTKVLVHAGSKMYTWDNYPDEFTPNTLTEIFVGVASHRAKYLEFHNTLLFLDGEALYYYDGEVFDYVQHKAYVPQTYTGNSPDAKDGAELNQRNFLTKFVFEGFTPAKDDQDTWIKTYKLRMKDLDADEVVIWKGTDNIEDPDNTFYTENASGDLGFTVDRTNGEVTFRTAPEYDIPGVECIYIKYAKESAGYPNRINHCTEMLAFDNRVFLTGNPAYPNVLFWSQNGDWSYYGELGYSDRSGASSAAIIALQQLQENKFLSIKGDTHQDGAYAVWTQSDLDDNFLAETYLSSMGNSTIGCVSNFAHCVFVDDNVFLSSNGLNAISRNLSVSLERNIEHRSTLIDPKLLAEDLEKAMVEQHRGYLYILFPNGHCYVADSTSRTDELTRSLEYEWAYLQDVRIYVGDNPVEPTNIISFNDKELYLCSSNGYLCKFYFDHESADGSFPSWTYNFDGRPLHEYVDTPNSWFGVQNRFKKLIRKYNDLYCDVRAHSDVEVLYHTEKKFMEDSKVLSYKADVFTFNDLDFYSYTDEQGNLNSNFTFQTLPPVSFVLKKLKGKRFRRLQLRVRSGGVNEPIIFKSLVVDAYVLTRKLK